MDRSQGKGKPDNAAPLSLPDEATDEGTHPNEESVARRAYERFEERGREHGHDLEDWFEAERELGRTGSTE